MRPCPVQMKVWLFLTGFRSDGFLGGFKKKPGLRKGKPGLSPLSLSPDQS